MVLLVSTAEFPPTHTQFYRIFRVKAFFLEVPKVSFLKISVFSERFITTGVEIRGKCLTEHQFTNLLKSVIPMRHDFFWHFSLLDHQEMAFPHLKGKVNLEKKHRNEFNSS